MLPRPEMLTMIPDKSIFKKLCQVRIIRAGSAR
jgi:hypothetical protein